MKRDRETGNYPFFIVHSFRPMSDVRSENAYLLRGIKAPNNQLFIPQFESAGRGNGMYVAELGQQTRCKLVERERDETRLV